MGRGMGTGVDLRPGFWRKDRAPKAERIDILDGQPKVFADNHWYSPDRAGAMVGLSAYTIRAWVRSEKMRTQPLPKGYLILGRSLNEYLDRLRVRRMQK